MITRRSLLAAATITAAAAPFLGWGRAFAAAGDYSRRARSLVEEALTIDMLGLITMQNAEWQRWAHSPEGMSTAEKERFRSSGIKVLHHSYGIAGPDAYDYAMTYLGGLHAFVARHGDLFVRVNGASDLEAARKSGRIGIIPGLQGADQFRKLDDVQHFHQLGLRVAQLTYNTQNFIGCGATERQDCGLSDFGVTIVGKMNEIGMLVDLSHCGERTTLDAIELSRKPIAVTHSNCKALVNHPRLKTDEAIKKMAAKGGVMGITGVRMFVRDKEPTDVEHMVDHIDHVAKLAGIEHVGIGSDADLNGYDDMGPEAVKAIKAGYKASYAFRDKIDTDGFDHPKKIFDLTEAMIRRKYSDAHIHAVLGGNFQRLLTQVWVAEAKPEAASDKG